MIFVSVGTQLPFDRLIRAVDEWAGSRGRSDVFAQIGPGEYEPRHMRFDRFITPEECARRMRGATAIVAHAGMGSIIGALEGGIPIVIMPRRADLGEHRNDHQMATARRFAGMAGVSVAFDADELGARLDGLNEGAATGRISPFASERLVEAIRAVIHGEPERSGRAAAGGATA